MKGSISPETLRAFGGDLLRAQVFAEKYAHPGETTPDRMWARIAREIASVEPDPEKREACEREFLWLLGDFRFVPGGRIMYGAGNPDKVTLLNCYFVAIRDDDLGAIYDAAYRAARTYSRGGGVGIDITPLRPRGAVVRNAARESTGAASFMELFSVTTGLVGQAGRRGALMLTIADSHPDVVEFCRAKRDRTSVRYANISVRVSDAFMRAVERDDVWRLVFERPETGRIERTIPARELWRELVEGAWGWAEPGVLFWDRVIEMGTTCYNGMTPQGTNPCSEIPLEDGGSCNLGSLNLSKLVLDPFTPAARVDWGALRRAVRAAVRFLDNVLEYNRGRHPLPEQEEAALRSRRIGLGITGLADALVMLGLRYDSDRAIELAEKIQETIKLEAYSASVELARERGPFPAFDAGKHLSQAFFRTFPGELVERIEKYGLRNAALLTIPPVGSGSALAGCSNGLEPIFALYYVRRSESLGREYFYVLHPVVAAYAGACGVDLSGIRDAGDPASFLRDKLPGFFVTAHEIDPLKRVDMQAALQRHIDQSISSTVNLPRSSTVETVERVYMKAWAAGCKGITVYREGSREGVLLTAEEARRAHALVRLAEKVTGIARDVLPHLEGDAQGSPEERIERVVEELVRVIRKASLGQVELVPQEAGLLEGRPRRLDGPTYRIPSQFGTLFLTVTERDGQPYELFLTLGKAGSDIDACTEAIGRLCSVILRLRVPGGSRMERLGLIYRQLEGIGGRTSYGFGPHRIRSVPDAVAAGIREYLADKGFSGREEGVAGNAGEITAAQDICPRCHGATLTYERGCASCPCGFKEC